MRRRGKGNRGILLISSYLLLSIFLVYSNILTVRSINHHLAATTLRNQFQAQDLVRGGLEQLHEELFDFLRTTVYQQAHNGNAQEALDWLDHLGGTPEWPWFNVADRDGDSIKEAADTVVDGLRGNPVCIRNLPTVPTQQITSGKSSTSTVPLSCYPATSPETLFAPRVWISDVANRGEDVNGNGILDAGEDLNGNGGVPDPANPLSPRVVMFEAEAVVNGIRKRIQAEYTYSLSTSNIFRYAYFVNNFGWMEPPQGARWVVNGDIRANGDLFFGDKASGSKTTWPNIEHLWVQGNMYASENPNVINPYTLLPAKGSINSKLDANWHDETQYVTSQTNYWEDKRWMGAARPNRRLTLPGKPAIGGAVKLLPEGQGWNTEQGYAPKKLTKQDTHDMPYLGDLGLYKQMAGQQNSSLSAPGYSIPDGVYKGPDNLAGTADDNTPIVLIGTKADPIVINGPVVIPGDVIIKGWVSGRGTIYAGRNIHIVGEVKVTKPYETPAIERDPATGIIQLRGENWNENVDWQTRLKLGKVCDDGTYVPPNPNGSIPAGGC